MEHGIKFRDWHYLRPLLTDHCPTNYLFVDAETTPVPDEEDKRKEHHTLRLWCAVSCRFEGGKWTRRRDWWGTNAQEFWALVYRLTSARRPLWLFSHNLGFDLTVLGFWQEVCQERWTFCQESDPETPAGRQGKGQPWHGFAVLEDPPTILKFRPQATAADVMAVDTLNYFRCSLAALGEATKVPKKPMPAFAAPDLEWKHYCMRDVEIIEAAVQALVHLVRQEKLGPLAPTISGQAWHAFRRRHLPDDQTVCIHGDSRAIKIERNGYFGGAVHTRYLGDVGRPRGRLFDTGPQDRLAPFRTGPVYVLDVQSAYPSVMNSYDYPAALHKVWGEMPVASIPTLCKGALVMAEVALRCKGVGFPVRRDGKSYYAAGEFITTLATPELLRAYKEGAVVAVLRAATYEARPLFRSFVQHMWSLRQSYKLSGEREFELVAKLLANSLFGKFGQRSYRWIEDHEVHPPIPMGEFWWTHLGRGLRKRCRSVGWLAQVQQERGEGTYSFPAIPAHITAYARETLLGYMTLAGLDNVLYTDTDSLHVLEGGYHRLKQAGVIEEGRLGALRLVTRAEEASYRHAKNYTLDGKDVVAGLPSSARKIAEGVWRIRKFEKLSSVIQCPGVWTITVSEATYQLRHQVRLGAVDTLGNVSTPLLNEF